MALGKKSLFSLLIAILIPASIAATCFGNPALMALESDGLLQSPTWYSVGWDTCPILKKQG
jgi:hypothetical protein